MARKPKKIELTPEQQAEILGMRIQVAMANGLALFVFATGIYLAIFDGRGWGGFIVGTVLALWTRHVLLPICPEWLEKMFRE